MNRNEIIKTVPIPNNQEVIIYDLTLKELLDIDVFEEYNKTLIDYKIKKENYILLDKELKEYEKCINNVYLFNSKWNKEDYLEVLQKEKKTYGTIYKEIKTIENNISVLERRLRAVNEQIKIQINRDAKEVQQKKEDIENEIKNNKDKILQIRIAIKESKIDKEKYEKLITDVKEDISFCDEMQKELELKDNEFKCKYCGTIITSNRSKNKIFNMLENKKNKSLKYLEKYNSEIKKNDQDINSNKNELKKYKNMLENNIQFKEQNYNFYIKKSIKVLELESTRDNIQKQILENKEKISKDKNIKTEEYQKLKDRISKYELSIENLDKMKENKEKFAEKYKILNNLKPILLELNGKLKLYKKFIELFYKVYEKKVNDYFGNNIKFKLYKFNSLELEETFEVYYYDIEYTQLSKTNKANFDKIYSEKISFIY